MKKITKLLIIGLLLILSIWASFAASKQLFKPENIYKYDLKNLESDLKKDYDKKKCNWWWGTKWEIDCNAYQIEGANDKNIRLYIKYMKTWKYSKAASIINYTNYIWHPYSNEPVFWAIWYLNGIIWIWNNWTQAFWWNFFYITIKDNILYEFHSDLWININFNNNNDYNNFMWNIEISIEWYNVKESHKYYKEFWLNYLQWKEKSKELDEFQNAFKSKIKKLFK